MPERLSLMEDARQAAHNLQLVPLLRGILRRISSARETQPRH